MTPTVASWRRLNAIKYCTKVSKTRAAGKESNSSAPLKLFLRNVTRSHRKRHFRQSFRDIFRPEVADGVMSGVILDRTCTHVPVKFCEYNSSHFQATAFCHKMMTGVRRRRRRKGKRRRRGDKHNHPKSGGCKKLSLPCDLFRILWDYLYLYL